ncbi:SpoIIE family protein phosphatase [candidate division GN15 bacterium]|nr:SpoIIE family protein phosphatase [candidate division GN15 bacterium]
MSQNKRAAAEMNDGWPSPSQFKRSIRIEFSLFVAGMILVLMVSAGYVITDRYVDTVTSGIVEKLVVQARAFSGTAGKHLISSENPDALLLNNTCKRLAADNDDVYWVGITNEDNQFVAHTELRKVMAGDTLEHPRASAGDYSLRDNELLRIQGDTILLAIPIEEKGVFLGHLGVASSTAQIAAARRDSIIAVASITIGVLLLGLPLTMIVLHRKLRPVKVITDQLKSAEYDDFTMDFPVSAPNEFGYLAATLRVAGDKLNQAQRAKIESDRLARELEIAREIQARLLPREFPQGTSFTCAGAYRSAREVGGDYYDFIQFDNNRLALLVADVSGKSLPGMLVMLMTRDIVRQVTRSTIQPADVLKRVNSELLTDIKKGMFVTMFFALIDAETGECTFASAGHNPLVHLGSDGESSLIKTKGYPLGMMPAAQFDRRLEEARIQLKPGDWLLQYTDGINEAQNLESEEYGMDRFIQAVSEARSLAPDQLVARALEDQSGFVGNAPQYDDITLLAVKWSAGPVDTEINRKTEALHAG